MSTKKNFEEKEKRDIYMASLINLILEILIFVIFIYSI